MGRPEQSATGPGAPQLCRGETRPCRRTQGQVGGVPGPERGRKAPAGGARARQATRRCHSGAPGSCAEAGDGAGRDAGGAAHPRIMLAPPAASVPATVPAAIMVASPPERIPSAVSAPSPSATMSQPTPAEAQVPMPSSAAAPVSPPSSPSPSASNPAGRGAEQPLPPDSQGFDGFKFFRVLGIESLFIARRYPLQRSSSDSARPVAANGMLAV